MTKLLSTTTLLLTLLVSPLMAEKIAGQYKCKVLGTSVTVIENGVEVKYPFYKDGIKANDIVLIDYEYSSLNRSNFEMINFKVSSPNNKDFLMREFMPFEKSEYFKNEDKRTLKASRESGHFGKDSLFISSQYPTGPYFNVALERYYKNDWQGTILVGHYIKTLIATIDCRHPLDKAEVIIDKLSAIGY